MEGKNNIPFAELVNGNIPVLVDFFATWCGPCKALAPILVDVKKELGDTARLVKVDVDVNPKAVKLYGVRGVPTLVLFHKGEVVWKKTGVQTKSRIVKEIKKYTS